MLGGYNLPVSFIPSLPMHLFNGVSYFVLNIFFLAKTAVTRKRRTWSRASGPWATRACNAKRPFTWTPWTDATRSGCWATLSPPSASDPSTLVLPPSANACWKLADSTPSCHCPSSSTRFSAASFRTTCSGSAFPGSQVSGCRRTEARTTRRIARKNFRRIERSSVQNSRRIVWPKARKRVTVRRT